MLGFVNGPLAGSESKSWFLKVSVSFVAIAAAWLARLEFLDVVYVAVAERIIVIIIKKRNTASRISTRK
jgi:hypothetical protein